MNPTAVMEVVTWPETHYVYVEKIGPFAQNAQQAWQQAHTLAAALSEHNRITGAMSLYKIGPQIYRAGFIIAAPPTQLPEGLAYQKSAGGKYARSVVTGSYAQLPQASGRAWDEFKKSNLQARDDFAIEHYVNDPSSTPEDKLITEILIPTA
jgi:DNA gyrase inhibitor GyrI